MLAKLLTDLKNKIDQRYADRIEKATMMKSVNRYEKAAIKKLDAIDAVIEWSIGYDIGSPQKRVIDAAVLYVQAEEGDPGIEGLYEEMQTAVLYFIDPR